MFSFIKKRAHGDTISVSDMVKGSRLKHIAFIMDGNGRWAKKRGLPREAGHKRGSEVFRSIVKYCGSIGIDVVTVYALSTENLKNRPKTEIDALMRLFTVYFDLFINGEEGKNLEVRFIGDIDPLPENIKEMMREIEAREGEMTQRLNIAINYGGRDELVRAVNGLISSGKSRITEEDIDFALDTAGCAAPDVIVRTGGEQRLSNFLMWQSAYSELYFSDALWPDYSSDDVDETVRWFAGRSRRFGGI